MSPINRERYIASPREQGHGTESVRLIYVGHNRKRKKEKKNKKPHALKLEKGHSHHKNIFSKL